MYEYDVTANRDLLYKTRGRIARRLDSRMYDEELKLKVFDFGVEQ